MSTEPSGTMHGWILRTNLRPFVAEIAEVIRCREDLTALTAGVDGSDADNDQWCTVVLDGDVRVEAHFARTTDGQLLVDVELDGLPEALEVRCAQLLDLCCRYHLVDASDSSSSTR
ncbi:hypothetical protein AB0F81_14475 [Actinoplanes sp. NPDC024001]|uniref:hypothetical protein n=1 Tax=Actinoplanes sp. NPDC024001 TaxID=3154598 RepID=UPI0033F61554